MNGNVPVREANVTDRAVMLRWNYTCSLGSCNSLSEEHFNHIRITITGRTVETIFTGSFKAKSEDVRKFLSKFKDAFVVQG